MEFTITLTTRQADALQEAFGITDPERYYREIIDNNVKDALIQYNQKRIVTTDLPIEEVNQIITAYSSLSDKDKTQISEILTRATIETPIEIAPVEEPPIRGAKDQLPVGN